MYRFDDTIIARATAPGSSARSIVRISGSNSLAAVERFFLPSEESSKTNELLPRQLTDQTAILTGWIRLALGEFDPVSIPVVLYYWPSGHGFTGEESVELHLPGSPPLVDAALRSLCSTQLVREAQRGEFTLRAFLNGRIDLTQAEAVLGVIDASGTKSLETALRQLAGGIGRPLTQLRAELLELLADWEAGFDFSEEDIEFVSRQTVGIRIQSAIETIGSLLVRMENRAHATSSQRVALIGLPNAGKSSLYNRMIEMTDTQSLVGLDPGAIVSDRAGTTRDYLESDINLDGITIRLTDTPGLEATESCNARSQHAKSQLATACVQADADLILLCVDSTRFGRDFPFPEERQILDDKEHTLLVATQTDRITLDTNGIPSHPDAIVTSSKTGFGCEQLIGEIRHRICGEGIGSEVVPSTALRCRRSLDEAQISLTMALELTLNGGDETVIASELRIALEKIGLVTGEVHTDDILDNIFSRFCIGK